MSVQPNNVCQAKLWETAVTATTATRAKMLVDQAPGGYLLGDSALYPASMPQVARGGQRIIGGAIASTDGTGRAAMLYRGSVLTSQSASATGTLQVASTSTITRASGDFRADGWTVGDALMVFGAGPSLTYATGASVASGVASGSPDHSLSGTTYTALSSVGVLCVITALTATTITVNGTPLTVETLPGCRLARVALASTVSIAANSGNSTSVSNTLLIGTANELDTYNLLSADRGLSLGPADILAVAAQATLSALPAQLQFTASSLLY